MSTTALHSELLSKHTRILNFTAISLLMVMSAAGGLASPVTVTDAPKLEDQNIVREISRKEVEIIMSTEEYVRKYFSDIPIMIQIAKCESHFRQLDKDGSIHRGVVNNEDVGVMQINEHYHLETSQEKNYNIYTLEGNTAYARELYEKQGTQPWSSSRACWGKYQTQTAQTDASQTIALNK